MKEQLEMPTMNTWQQQATRTVSHASTGVVLFSSTGQLLFMNQEAQVYIRQLQPPSTRENGIGLIPEDIHAVVRDLIGRLMQCEHPKEWETIHLERLCFAADHKLLLRGLCIPDEPLEKNGRILRILIVIEPLVQKLECPDASIQQRYHLTEREQMVIRYLMFGLTNKEIANRLNLSEYTVKEHLKRIMHKTKTTTRTGLLARMIFPMPERTAIMETAAIIIGANTALAVIIYLIVSHIWQD